MGNFNLKHLVHAERQLDLMSFYNKCLMYIVYKTNLCTLYACGKKKVSTGQKIIPCEDFYIFNKYNL